VIIYRSLHNCLSYRSLPATRDCTALIATHRAALQKLHFQYLWEKSMSFTTKWGTTLAVTLAALSSSPMTAPATAQTPAGKNIVLVHGAWADGSGWQDVYKILKGRGFNVSIVQNPLTSLKDDVAATQRVLARQDGPSILVGHSYGGMVITEAGEDASVAGLV